jgi:transcriptional regulator with XRE-family HTH domain
MAPQLFHLQTRFETLKDWREAQRLSQREAAEVVGMDVNMYSRLERGVYFAKGPLAKRIYQITGVPLEVVVGAI